MDIIKKNLVLFIVIGSSVIASAVLVIFVIGGYGEMTKAVAKIEDIKKQIKELGKQKPTPHSANQIRIKKDIEEYRNLVDNVSSSFGQPYRDALKFYISALDMDEKSFMEKFTEFWNQNATVGSNRYQLFQKFINGFSNFKQTKAKEVFRQNFQKYTCEKIDDSNINDIIMYAIGVERTLAPTDFRVFLSQMQSDLIKFLNQNDVTTGDKFNTFSFEEYMSSNNSNPPPKDEIAKVVDRFIMVGDLVKMAVNSGIKDLISIKRGNLDGTEDGKFTRYRFSLEVQSDMDNLQKFVNALNDAFVMNKIYVIKSIELEIASDKAKEIITEVIDFHTGKSTTEGGPTASSMTGAPGMIPANMTGAIVPANMMGPGNVDSRKAATTKKDEEKKLDIPFYREKSYGKAVIGGNKKVKMIIDVDYVVFNRQKFTIQE